MHMKMQHIECIYVYKLDYIYIEYLLWAEKCCGWTQAIGDDEIFWL